MLETYRFYNCIFGFWFFWKCFVHIWYNMITSKKRDENHQYPKWYQDQSENGYLSILILIVFPACLIKSLQTSWFMSNTWVPLISTMKSLSFSPVSYAIVLKMIWQKKKDKRFRGKRVTKYAQKFHNITLGISLLLLHYCSKVWQYGLWSFQTGGTRFGRFLPKN